MTQSGRFRDGDLKRLSESNEMYLVVIWRLTENSREVSVSDIARALGHSLSTVSEKVMRLTQSGLLHHEWRERVSMTSRGRRMACRTIRRRRLLETFLFRMAGYAIHELYEEACKLEHVISERFADELDRMLGYPQHNPHGHIIPGRDGRVRAEDLEPLSVAGESRMVRIARLRSDDSGVLAYAASLGLLPGRSFMVVEKAPLHGPMTLDDGSRCIAISHEVASIIDIHTGLDDDLDESVGGRQSFAH